MQCYYLKFQKILASQSLPTNAEKFILPENIFCRPIKCYLNWMLNTKCPLVSFALIVSKSTLIKKNFKKYKTFKKNKMYH